MHYFKSVFFTLIVQGIITAACGDPLKVQAQSGQNVLLKCLGHTHYPIEAVKWLKPDLRSDHYVYFYREKRPVEYYQHEDFVGRVELRDPQMTDGDFSLILKNVTINDTGRYECEISYSNTERVKQAPSKLYCSFDLKVDEGPEGSGFASILQLEKHLILTVSIATVVILIVF
ncbi:Programmed cell death 1 ligand 1 [Channa argus]|uniref:Programmed cell death 1 ligand 1 n=1 Tax=Channa argus TaxID=215402 RepID=A0A6G1Q6Q9_CHAAH|nr:Programmed cell death 1 ligand 1 [Channa argus]